ncbi:hypothetical protein ACFQY8_02400 [Alloscardovia venturai]|uniref:Uncharacterized protein n=1 Tax=Alloscardovia venturai TaxID=1769421 RepID=A0ABW2Y7N1_9BIFI
MTNKRENAYTGDYTSQNHFDDYSLAKQSERQAALGFVNNHYAQILIQQRDLLIADYRAAVVSALRAERERLQAVSNLFDETWKGEAEKSVKKKVKEQVATLDKAISRL